MNWDWGWLSFLANPWFVVPWYFVGLVGAVWVAYDTSTANTRLAKAMKWAWPILVLFFSVIGIALYLWTSRPPGIGQKQGEEKKQVLEQYTSSKLKKVTGAVSHCVAGDGLGIMTAMVIARLIGMKFWQEFWFEYGLGFVFGWFIFQLKSMTMMTQSKSKALAMAFRAEFFSMLAVMPGMGIVMGFITPLVMGEQPKPYTFAFWGFGALGLLVGFILTYPENGMLIKIGWKHGTSAH